MSWDGYDHPGESNCRSPSSGNELRRLAEALVLFLIAVLVLRAIAVEPYGIPTGSMAPALAGNHKAAACPSCGYPVMIGRRDDRSDSQASHRCYALASCPNCGRIDLGLDRVAECAGDRVLVDKNVFELRRPRRWEMAVFRGPVDHSRCFVKRVVGLPGEAVQICDGDVHVDRAIARKSLEECKALRILVFDNNHQPRPGDNGYSRWETDPPLGPLLGERGQIRLAAVNASSAPNRAGYQWLVYRHRLAESPTPQEQPIWDTSSYNGGEDGRIPEPVHDFLIECHLEVVRGEGRVAFTLADGADEIMAEVPVGRGKEGVLLSDARGPLRTAPAVHLMAGRSYRIELAFVDRRATLAIDGRSPFPPVDLPAVELRPEVRQPVRIGTWGVEAVVRNFRLYRDVHYTAIGSHGIRTPYRLRAGEYFVLGDNSPNSDDSRFWPNPAVPESSFLGKPFLVHMPSRFRRWEGFGRRWEYQGPDWGRVRWVR